MPSLPRLPAASSALQRIAQRTLTAEAILWLGIAWVALDVLPGRIYRVLLPRAVPAIRTPAEGKPPPACCTKVASAVHRARRWAPWRNVCFHHALAVHCMLGWRRIPHIVHYGVAVEPGLSRLEAHVWISVEGNILVGGESAGRFQEIARYQSAATAKIVLNG